MNRISEHLDKVGELAQQGVRADALVQPHSQFDVQVRWLIRRDMAEVLGIEQATSKNPWNDEDFLCCLRQRNCIGMVAEHDGRIFGFMIYELHKSRLHILNFAIAPEARRQGIGSQMVLRLIDKLSQQRRNEIVATVRESNLDAQLFFRQMKFKAVEVQREYFEDTGEAGYTMLFRLGQNISTRE